MRIVVTLLAAVLATASASPEAAARSVLRDLGCSPVETRTGGRVAGTARLPVDGLDHWVLDAAPSMPHGWTSARVRVDVTLSPETFVTATFERFGVPDARLLIPPAWTGVPSNGRLERVVTKAVTERSAGRESPVERLTVLADELPAAGRLGTDDSPFIDDVPVSADTGTGNQNETTLGMWPGGYMCGAWNDNRTGEYHVGFARSTDYGSTWFPDTLMFEPSYSEDGDPVICVDDSGTIYYFWLSFNRSPSRGDVVLAKSTDWGQTWGPTLNVTPGTPSSLDDKPWATIDGDNVFLTWYEYGTSYDLKFKRSTDRGATWSSGVTVGTSGNGTFPFRGLDSTVYVGWGMTNIRLNKSTDMGATWQGQRTVISCPWSPGSTPWRMNNIPSFGTSLDRTKLYVVFADSRLGSNQTDVFFSRSTDAGDNWSTPVKVNDTQSGDGTHQFFPWLAVDPFDRIHVAWHDSRAGSNRVAQYYSYSDDFGANWAANIRISDSAYQASTFLGDYTACLADSERVYALWCDTRNGSSDPDVFFSRAEHIGQRARDVGITALLAPADTVDSGTVAIPAVVVENFGTVAEVFPAHLTIGASYADSVVESLPAGAIDTLQFAPWTADELGLFQIRCSTALAGDTNPANDLLVDSVVVIPFTGIQEPGPGARPLLSVTGPGFGTGRLLVRYTLPRACLARLELLGPDGRVRRVIADGYLAAGSYQHRLDTRALPAGVQLLRLRAGSEAIVRKLVTGVR